MDRPKRTKRLSCRMLVLLAFLGFAVACEPPIDSTPTPESVAAAADFTAAPEGFINCGNPIPTSGFPTTRPFIYDHTCIVDAASTLTPAHYSWRGRDFTGGMEGVIYRVSADATLERISFTADPVGTITQELQTCRAFQAISDQDPDLICVGATPN